MVLMEEVITFPNRSALTPTTPEAPTPAEMEAIWSVDWAVNVIPAFAFSTV